MHCENLNTNQVHLAESGCCCSFPVGKLNSFFESFIRIRMVESSHFPSAELDMHSQNGFGALSPQVSQRRASGDDSLRADVMF